MNPHPLMVLCGSHLVIFNTLKNQTNAQHNLAYDVYICPAWNSENCFFSLSFWANLSTVCTLHPHPACCGNAQTVKNINVLKTELHLKTTHTHTQKRSSTVAYCWKLLFLAAELWTYWIEGWLHYMCSNEVSNWWLQEHVCSRCALNKSFLMCV